MSKNRNITEKHISALRRDETIRQVKLRIELLNQFLKNGVPDGFTAHINQKDFLSYSNEIGILPKSRGAIKGIDCPVSELDQEVNDTSIVNALAYLQLKREQVIQKQSSNTIAIENKTDDVIKNENPVKSRSKTKCELNLIIKSQAELINSLAAELLIQRSANNDLVNLVKTTQKPDYVNALLRPHYAQYQETLCEIRKKNIVGIREVLTSINEILNELEYSKNMELAKIVPLVRVIK